MSSILLQQTAGTLGQGGFSIGTGGDLALDAWSLSRGGQISKAGDKGSFTEWAGSLTGNLNAASPKSSCWIIFNIYGL